MSSVKRATPIIVVNEIEPCLPFWTEKLGFEVVDTVPHEDRIGFAILRQGEVELMYQSRDSVDADLVASGAPKALGKELMDSTSTLYVQVDRLDDVLAVLDDTELLVPRRKTFYGMDELFVRPPCGTLVGLAARVAE